MPRGLQGMKHTHKAKAVCQTWCEHAPTCTIVAFTIVRHATSPLLSSLATKAGATHGFRGKIRTGMDPQGPLTEFTLRPMIETGLGGAQALTRCKSPGDSHINFGGFRSRTKETDGRGGLHCPSGTCTSTCQYDSESDSCTTYILKHIITSSCA